MQGFKVTSAGIDYFRKDFTLTHWCELNVFMASSNLWIIIFLSRNKLKMYFDRVCGTAECVHVNEWVFAVYKTWSCHLYLDDTHGCRYGMLII